MKKRWAGFICLMLLAGNLFAEKINDIQELDAVSLFRFGIWSDDRGDVNSTQYQKGDGWLREGTQPASFVLGGGDNSKTSTWINYIGKGSTPDLWKNHYYNCIGDHENSGYGSGQSDWGAGGEMFDHLPGFWTQSGLEANHYEQNTGNTGEEGDSINWNVTNNKGNGCDYYKKISNVNGSGVDVHIISVTYSDSGASAFDQFRESSRQFMEDKLTDISILKDADPEHNMVFVLAHNGQWPNKSSLKNSRKDLLFSVADYINDASSHSYERKYYNRNDDSNGSLCVNSGRVGGGSDCYLECHVLDNPVRLIVQEMPFKNKNSRGLQPVEDNDHRPFMKNLSSGDITYVDWNNVPLDDVQPPTGDPNDADFIFQNVPVSMLPGQTVQAQVTLKNTGTNTWTDVAGHRLGSQNVQDNTIWGLNRVILPQDVAPNAEVTFTFDVTAPTTPGTYNFQWRMVDGVAPDNGWFGASTDSLSITVGDSANLANSSTYLADSGGFQSGKEVGFIHDGSTTTPSAKNAASVWVEYDFGAEYDLTSARLFGDGEGGWNSQSWTLQVWNGSSYVDVFTDADCYGNLWDEETFTVRTSKAKVMITGTASGTEAFEVEIWGEPANGQPPQTQIVAAWDFASEDLGTVPSGWTTWDSSTVTNLGATSTVGSLTLEHTAGTTEVKDTASPSLVQATPPLLTADAGVLNDYLRINNDQTLTLSGLTEGVSYRIQFTGNCLMHTNGDRNALIVMNGSTSNYLFASSSSGNNEAGYSPYFNFTASAGNTELTFDFSKHPSPSGASTGVSGMIVESTVTSPETGYDNWATDHSAGAADADDDGDGMDNLLEYAIGGDPNSNADTIQPTFTKSNDQFEYHHLKRNDDSNLIYAVEVCTDLTLGNWTSVGVVTVTNSVSDPYDDVTHTISTLDGQAYLRLKITDQ